MSCPRRLSVLLLGSALFLPAVPAGDMAWLNDHKEPVAPKAPAAKPGAQPAPKPETIQLAPKP